MNYSAPTFLAVFPPFAALYWWIRPHLGRLVLLLAGSVLFYAVGSARGLPVLVGVIAITYAGGLAMARFDRRADAIAGAVVALLVADLALFKYAGFIDDQLPAGLPHLPSAVPPLGISFYTFEAIAYIVDLKRGMIDAERSPLRLALFIAFFPHLIAGPIMRADDLIPQLKIPVSWNTARTVGGIELFVQGLAKKRLLADPVGMVADAVFAAPFTVGTEGAWLGVLAYTVQIYADFSGYTDMARGIARILGIDLPTNFSSPYAAHSITDFWQRWHITLSSWLRDYVWIPLGGLRHRGAGQYAAVFLTLLIGGIWHGAGWTFAVWGAYQGAWLAFERRWAWWRRMPQSLAIALTLAITVNGWVLFRATSLGDAGPLFAAMYLGRSGWTPDPADALYVLAAFALVVGAMAIGRTRRRAPSILRRPGAVTGAAYGVVVVASVVLAPTPTPFIYFRF